MIRTLFGQCFVCENVILVIYPPQAFRVSARVAGSFSFPPLIQVLQVRNSVSPFLPLLSPSSGNRFSLWRLHISAFLRRCWIHLGHVESTRSNCWLVTIFELWKTINRVQKYKTLFSNKWPHAFVSWKPYKKFESIGALIFAAHGTAKFCIVKNAARAFRIVGFQFQHIFSSEGDVPRDTLYRFFPLSQIIHMLDLFHHSFSFFSSRHLPLHHFCFKPRIAQHTVSLLIVIFTTRLFSFSLFDSPSLSPCLAFHFRPVSARSGKRIRCPRNKWVRDRTGW